MKNAFALSILLAAAFVYGEALRFAPRPVSERIRQTSQEKQMLFSEGKVQFEIVAEDGACPVAKFAAQELSEHLGRCLGSRLEVLGKASGTKPVLFVGKSKLAASAGLNPATLDRDGYFIRSIGRDVVILGEDDPKADPITGQLMKERGTLFGVYDFLETFAGVRFYFPGDIGTCCPKLSSWSLPEINIQERPDAQFRRMYTVNYFGPGLAKWYEDCDQKKAERLAWLRHRFNTSDIPNCHGLAYLFLVERFGKTHSEYFALNDNGKRLDGSNISHDSHRQGQICFSSRELQNIIFEDAKACLRNEDPATRNLRKSPDSPAYWPNRHSPGKFFNLMPNDSCYPCKCENCRPHFEAGKQEASNFIWQYKTDIARRLQSEGVPGYVTMMAYSQYQAIPACDIPSNVLVQLAVMGPWKERLPQLQAKEDALIQAWDKKLGAKTYLWTYINKYGGAHIPGLPNSTPRAVGSYFKRVAPHIFGAFIESETDNWIFGALNYYIFSRIMWDASVEPEAILDEFYRKMYGAAAPEMEQFFTALEDHWLGDILSNVTDTPAGPVAVVPSDNDIWSKIYNAEELERLAGLFETGKAHAAKDADALQRLAFTQEQFLAPIAKAHADYVTKTGNRDTWMVAAQPCKEPILIDGKLDEAAWKTAAPAYLLPALKANSVEVHTRVRMLFDADNFYFAYECEEPDTDKLVGVERKPDDPMMWQDNNVELFLNPSGDRRDYYQIIMNSLGRVADQHQLPGQADWTWNSGVELKISVVPEKMWIAELRVPRAGMGEAGASVVANFNRSRARSGEKAQYFSWSHFIKNFSDVENFGRVYLGALPESGNIIKDSGFAQPIVNKRFIGQNWFAHPVIYRDEAVFRTCGASVRLEKDSRQIGQYLELKPGTRYRLSYYIRTQDVTKKEKYGSGVWVTVRFGGPKNITFPQNAYTGTMPWTRQEFEFTTPLPLQEQECPYIRLNLGKTDDGIAWFDQVELCEIPEK